MAGLFSTQSVHKQGAGFSQASQIHKRDAHIKGQRRYVEHKRFNKSFLMNASTSPFYPLFASVEMNAKVHEGKAGEMLWDRCIALGIECRKKLREFCHYYEKNGRERGREVVLRPVRARQGHDPEFQDHQGRRRRALGEPPHRRAQARAAVLELPSRSQLARIRRLCGRLRDGRSQQAGLADARHRSRDRRATWTSACRRRSSPTICASSASSRRSAT